MIRPVIRSIFRKCGFEVRKIKSASLPSDPFDVQKALLDRMDLEEPVIFDVGANRGGTVKNYRARFPESKIYCFEPFPTSIEVLHQKYDSDPKVKIVPLAVADKPGERVFYLSQFHATHSLLPRPKTARRYYPKKAGPKSNTRINVTTIDEFIDCNRVDKLDILKLDIQGGELMALQGAIKTLREKNVPLIYTEATFVPHYEGNPLFSDLCSYLDDFGYTVFDIYHLTRANNGQLRFGEVLFVSAGLREAVIDKFQEEP